MKPGLADHHEKSDAKHFHVGSLYRKKWQELELIWHYLHYRHLGSAEENTREYPQP